MRDGSLCACSCRLPLWLALVKDSCMSLHTLVLAVCLQLLLAFVACIGAGLKRERAHVAARCVLAALACLCGLRWCRAHVRVCTRCCSLCACSCSEPLSLALVQGSCVILHALLFAVRLQLLLAFVACIGAGLLRGPAHVAARCVLAAVACLCGLHWCRAHV